LFKLKTKGEDRHMTASEVLRPVLLLLLLAHSTLQTLPIYSYTVIRKYPHSGLSFTEGLLYDEESGHLWESTGGPGVCGLFEIDLMTGNSLRHSQDECSKFPNSMSWFGEGLALHQGKLFQLTWTSGTGFIFDRTSLAKLGTFHYNGQGWGLTTDGKNLIMSNGSQYITFYEANMRQREKEIKVTRDGKDVTQLNELEYLNGEIWANVWHSTDILRINPQTGRVLLFFSNIFRTSE
jgi:glutamine cyclotransferase